MKNLYIFICLLAALLLCSCASDTPTQLPPTTEMSTSSTPSIATVPLSSEQIIGQDYNKILQDLDAAGFSNIQLIGLDDLTSDDASTDGQITMITIAGQAQFNPGQEYSPDAPVIIQHHNLKRILVPLTTTAALNMNYLKVAQQFAECGFYNIITDEKYDGTETKTEVRIDGYNEFSETLAIPYDTPIYITGYFPEKTFLVTVTIDFEANWFLDKHDIFLTVGNNESVALSHGKGGSYNYQLPAGSHQITVTSQENANSSATLTLNVDSETQALYHVQTHSSTIDFEEKSITKQLQNDQIMLNHSAGYYLRKNVNDCITALKAEGFSSFSTNVVTSGIWGQTPAGAVTAISIAGNDAFSNADIVSKNAPIVIHYYIPSITFGQESITVTEGDVFSLNYNVSETDFSQDISFVIEQPTIVASTNANTFTAIAVGESNIIAMYGDSILAECHVTVEMRKIYIDSIVLAEETLTVSAGAVFIPQYTYMPTDANQLVLDATFSGDLLEQLPDGSLYAKAPGTAQATLSQNGKQLGIVDIQIVDVPVEKITFDKAPFSISLNRTMEFPFSLTPENATNLYLSAYIEDEQIATVELDIKGPQVLKVTGKSIGKTKLHLRVSEGIEAIKEIVVTEVSPSAITVTSSNFSPMPETSGTLSAHYEPDDVTIKEVLWKSSAPKIVKVNSDGSFEALKPGTATITATHKSGVSGTCEIVVQPIPAAQITIVYDINEIQDFTSKEKMQLSAEVYPVNTTDKTVIWTSSDPTIATVSEKGLVKGVTAGDVTITATAHNGKTTEIKITVKPAPQTFKVTYTITRKSNNHVGSSWAKGFEFNGEATKSGAKVSIMQGDEFRVCAWAEERDSKPDYGSYFERLTLTPELCKGFTLEDDFYVYENAGRYSGSESRWHVKIKFTPVN